MCYTLLKGGIMSQEEKKKSSKALIYVLAGCGVLSFIAIVVVIFAFLFVGKKIKTFASNPEEAIVKIVAANNPDVEVVEIDRENQKITIKNNKTGEVMVLNFSDVKKGKIRWEGKSDKGSIEMRGGEEGGKIEIYNEGNKSTITYGSDSNIPKWLPEFKGFNVVNQVNSRGESENAGTIELETEKDMETVIKEIENAFKGKGFKINRTFSQTGEGQKSSMLQGGSEDGKKTFFVIISEENSKVKCLINYNEKLE